MSNQYYRKLNKEKGEGRKMFFGALVLFIYVFIANVILDFIKSLI